MDDKGLISIEYERQSKTMTFVFEPTAGYVLEEIAAFAEGIAQHIKVYEGDTLAWTGEANKWIAS